VAGERIALESLDIVTLGAGGGSIGHVGAGGTLQVGPRSAGAVPGPVAYGQGGTEPAVTDVNLVLGYLHPDNFLGGARKLDRDAAFNAFERLGASLGIAPMAAAEGVHHLANFRMADGIRVATMRRGVDPRDFTLLSFGGAAGLHASAVARELGMRRVAVPVFAAGLDLNGITGRLMRNGKLEATGKTDDPMGALAWLANLAVERDRPITASMVVITGSVIVSVDIVPGERLDFALDGIGKTSMTAI
jgi:N-methylhydantoinase A